MLRIENDYAGMVVALVVFSIGMVITEFCLIPERNNIDRLMMFSMIIALIVLIAFFGVINLHMQDLGRNNEKIAKMNKHYRIAKEGEKQYSDGKGWNNFIKYLFYLVGMGYPLRFLVGISAVYTGFDMNQWPETLNGLLIVVVMWFYGSFSSVLAWSGVERLSYILSKIRRQCFQKSIII